MDYFNVYDLTIPGRPATVPTKKLIERIDSLEKNNESLRRELVEKKFNTKDQSMIDIITTMEKRIELLVIENKDLKTIVTDYENNPTTSISDQVKSDVDLNVSKLNALSTERDELKKKLNEMEILVAQLQKEKLANEEALKSLKTIDNQKNEVPKEDKLVVNDLKKDNTDNQNSKANKAKEKEVKKVSENTEKEVVNNQEKFFPAIDELKIPVKKSTLKL
jgi:hypothetical protein